MARPRTAKFRARGPEGGGGGFEGTPYVSPRRRAAPRMPGLGCPQGRRAAPGTAGTPRKISAGSRNRGCAGGSRAIRGVLLFGYFLLDKQEKVALGAGREHPALILT